MAFRRSKSARQVGLAFVARFGEAGRKALAEEVVLAIPDLGPSCDPEQIIWILEVQGVWYDFQRDARRTHGTSFP
jgi:hypothetical protein